MENKRPRSDIPTKIRICPVFATSSLVPYFSTFSVCIQIGHTVFHLLNILTKNGKIWFCEYPGQLVFISRLLDNKFCCYYESNQVVLLYNSSKRPSIHLGLPVDIEATKVSYIF